MHLRYFPGGFNGQGKWVFRYEHQDLGEYSVLLMFELSFLNQVYVASGRKNMEMGMFSYLICPLLSDSAEKVNNK